MKNLHRFVFLFLSMFSLELYSQTEAICLDVDVAPEYIAMPPTVKKLAILR